MKNLQRFCALMTAVILIAGFGTVASAAGTVTYDSKADEFIFEPGTEHSPTSLFENFLNVMPGDTLTEQILIKNENSKKVKIKVYMRSLGAQEDTNAFLNQMNLTVTQKDDSILFDAPADEVAQLNGWKYLGTIYSGGEITLDVTLEVPVTMGDEFQNEIGYIDWQFKIEEFPVEPSDPSAETGDTSSISLYSGLMIVSFVGLFIVLMLGKRKRPDKKA